MKIVGDKDRSEIELDPVEAFHRGAALDAMLRDAFPPLERTVLRASHAEFNRLDDERQLERARILNAGDNASPGSSELP